MSERRVTLGGRYQIDGTLGEGGMATVYRGNDSVLGRPVAVKVLAPRYAGDKTFVARFRREAQSAAAMNHPNVVNVYDTGSDDGTHYIVMELVEGRTLRDVVAADAPLLPERAAEIAQGVAAALAFAHERGIVHRDVKPGNIMITPSGDVKVMDFGIARATSGESLTQTATVLGTATYLSPEQAQGEQVDARSDLYSLGIVLYEMLTGHPPFAGESPVAVAYKHVREDAVRPSELNRDVPEPLEAIVLKAMAKNPQNRYASANEMREDLERFLAGVPVQATPLLPPERTEIVTRQARDTVVLPAETVDETRDRRRVLAIVLLTLLALGVLGALFWFLARNILGESPQVTVPNCVGSRVDACRAALEERDLRLVVEERVFDPDTPAGIVLRQDPPRGELVDEGSTVGVVVSKGAQTVKVPNLAGRTVDEARDALEQRGLQLGFKAEEFSNDVPEGRIIRSDPAAGTEVQEGTNVDVVVSRGPETVEVEVPALGGMTPEEAANALNAAGLVIGDQAQAICVPPTDPGTVCDQNPEPGEKVEQGSEVDITVMQEVTPSPTEPSPTATVTPTE